MPKFLYRAKDWSGKTIKGFLELNDRVQVIESVKGSGLIPLSVEMDRPNILNEYSKKFLGKVGLKQVSTFTRQLSTMMTAGLPLTDALSLLKNQTAGNGMMFDILEYTLGMVRGGQSLGDSLKKYQDVFGEAYVASIDAGESGGVLQEILTKLADGLEDQNEFQGKVKGAMIYPIIVVIGMIIVAFIMMIFVIPKLLGLYADMGSKLPMVTQILMAVSNGMAKNWYLFPIIAVGAVSAYRVGMKNAEFRFKLDTLKLKAPIMGPLIEKTILADTIRTLSMLLSAGISLVDALKIVAKVAGNEVYNRAYIDISERVQKGFSISNSFEDAGVFPMIVNQMVATGEATGKLDEVLIRVAEYFSTEAEQSVKSLTAAIEPLIMIVLGVGVGFLVIAVIMPIYNLTSSF
ncbi:MAG: type II secretion system F family protein [Candidatus Shapirobacteria bacterium]|jgi:type IV pilus assembly protein PilC